MKPRKFYTRFPLSLLALILLNQASAQFITGHPSAKERSAGQLSTNRTTQPDLPDNATPEWYTQAVSQIQQFESAFYPQKEKMTFKVANAAHRIGFLIQPSGYSVHNIRQHDHEALWQVHFRLLGTGRPSASLKPASHFSATTDADQLRYISKALEIQYTNSREGLRQNFILKEKPSGSTPLIIQIRVTGDLKARLLNDTKLVFDAPDSAGLTRLSYEDLKVWDDHYTPLKASMQLDKDLLTIRVDDSQAVYPITIDPINRTPDWNTDTDGLLAGLGLSPAQVLSSLYGYTVCGLGDVNGDNYGDVAVSAPALIDVFSSSSTLISVGAVFVYYGSPTGLSTVPNKKLQPNTAVAGALFGASIDAGDVTGDGINDIVIGAPLDSYQASAAALLGNVNVNVTAGKVYIYPGGSLAAPNPSNFLEIKLDGPSFFSTGILNLLGTNINVKALFGFSLAVTDDLNNDGKKDLIVGCPGYVGISLTSVRSGAAFVLLSDPAPGNNTFPTVQSLEPPSINLLGLINLPLLNVGGLLFGFSVDGVGDYNGDGKSDVVVGVPAGITLSGIDVLVNGQVLGGSALVYYGKANNTGVTTTAGVRLQAAPTGLLSNAVNLFGLKVKGVKGINGIRNGNIVVGAPLGGLLANALSLTIKTGNVHIFKKKASSPASPVISDQVLESPRPPGILTSILNNLQLNLLFGTAIDNAYDVNGDTQPDLVIGEPLSSGVNLSGLQVNAVGGSAYVYYGDGTGGYAPTPPFSVSATYGSDFLSVNTTALLGFSVAGAPGIRGPGSPPRIIVGSPVGALDFDNSLLNLGSTLGTVLDFAAGSNGLGKAYSFDALSVALPVTLVEFKANKKTNGVELTWDVREESNLNVYEVQRSTDGVHFETIALVFPWDNGRASNDYHYTDQKPFDGINYYRLNMVDKDGSRKYSTIVSVRIGAALNTQIVIAPNPVKERIRVIFSGLSNGMYRVELRNTNGQLQQSRQITITQREQIEHLDRTAASNAGIYWLTVYDKNNQKIGTSRVIIQ